MTKVYEMSIEPVGGKVYRNGAHLGTDEKVARSLVVERFHALNRVGMPILTIALWFGNDMVDVFDGQWSSESGFED